MQQKTPLLYFLCIVICSLSVSCSKNSNTTQESTLTHQTEETIDTTVTISDKKPVSVPSIKMTNGFDFPVGKPDAKGYYYAQKFGENYHLGDDWNGVKGGNSDLGDPIYSIGNGYVSHAKDIGGGWGNVIRIIHHIDDDTQVESLYAHCLKMNVQEGEYVNKGQMIGEIGNNNGQYPAHLHFEMRNEINLPIGGGYSDITKGYIDPTEFIKNNR